ncbi:MAG: hypothetical protein ACI4XJ_04680 [Eubacteriales bacterium]
MKRTDFLVTILICILFLLPAAGCTDGEPKHTSDESAVSDYKQKEQSDMTDKDSFIIPVIYDNPAVVTADKTTAGSADKWQLEVFRDGQNNDAETDNALIISPYHHLVVNGIEIPVYTARCGKGSHSFAWIDIRNDTDDFVLDVSLTLERESEKCAVLPESRGVTAEKQGDMFVSRIADFGSYTYTFARSKNSEVTDPKRIPLTIMVTREIPLEVPDGYRIVEIDAGYHETDELEFTQTKTVYVMKAGLHDISSIGVPSDSILYLERGAYLRVTDRQNADGSFNTKTAIHMDYAENSKIISRGLLDCGAVLGGADKHKHVFNAGCSKDVSVEGLTIINSNTWTMCFYNCDNAVAEHNLLLGYRTYSDGIMMSECRNSAGRYNFVRTGDDAIEFKGTGWWGSGAGYNCVYEYNDIWTDKGAGYCLTWENACPMSDMVFRNNSIGFAQPTWTERNTALDCLLGSDAQTRWENVKFENIEIYRVISPNVINTQISGDGGILDNILFKDITVKSAEQGVFVYRMNYSAAGGAISDIRLENISFCGRVLSADDKYDETMISNSAPEFFDAALSIEP